MILIFKEDKDESIKKIISWLKILNCNYHIIDEKASIDIVDIISIGIKNNDIKIKINNSIVHLSQFKVIYFRRGYFQFKLPALKNWEYIDHNLKTSIETHLKMELSTLNNYIYYYIEKNSFVINNPLFFNYNKLIALDKAKDCGLKVPDTIITKSRLNILKVKNYDLITKPIQDSFIYKDKINNLSWFNRTKYIQHQNIPKSFYLSLFQSRINNSSEDI